VQQLFAEQLQDAPPESLDPVLDATEACLARHGLSKTSLSDIARELGVAPSTVYRKVGSVENAARLVFIREGQRLVTRIPEVVAGITGPRVITVFMAECINTIRTNPMVEKILRDEFDWVGRVATRQLHEAIEVSARGAAPFFQAAMDAGHIRKQDPVALAHWTNRIALACLLAPPPGDLREALDDLLLPMLEPMKGTKRA
jgi:AcrR family transcriptional regulator